MELKQLLRGKSIFIDTAPFIYFIEKNNRYHQLIKQVITLLDNRQATGITSTISLLEVLVLPLREGKHKTAAQYKAVLLDSAGLTTLEITHDISELAAGLRAKHGLRTPDALQLATALTAKADYFLTNDAALKKVHGIKVLLLDDFVPQQPARR